MLCCTEKDDFTCARLLHVGSLPLTRILIHALDPWLSVRGSSVLTAIIAPNYSLRLDLLSSSIGYANGSISTIFIVNL